MTLTMPTIVVFVILVLVLVAWTLMVVDTVRAVAQMWEYRREKKTEGRHACRTVDLLLIGNEAKAKEFAQLSRDAHERALDILERR